MLIAVFVIHSNLVALQVLYMLGSRLMYAATNLLSAMIATLFIGQIYLAAPVRASCVSFLINTVVQGAILGIFSAVGLISEGVGIATLNQVSLLWFNEQEYVCLCVLLLVGRACLCF